jgi:phytol kinase
MAVVILTILFLLFFLCVDRVTSKFKLDKEYSRKFVHIVSGSIVAFLPIFISFKQIALLSLIFIPIMYVSKIRKLFPSIHDVKRSTFGEIYFPLSILIVSLVFPETRIFVYAILVMAISDGLASILGLKYGKKKYGIFSASKSYFGSTTFFICTTLIGILVLTTSLFNVLILAMFLTLIEAGLSEGLDNLVLPPVAAFLAQQLIKFN